MQAHLEHTALIELVKWIDENTSDLTLPRDERTQIAIGCLDVALEHQTAIALLYSAELPRSMLALLRVQYESLVRGLWLHQCASDTQLEKFKKGILDKTFDSLVKEYEAKMGTPSGVLSDFKISACKQMNDFTYAGFLQVSRRYAPSVVSPSYPKEDLVKILGMAGALGLIAASQVIAIAGREDLIPAFQQQMSRYTPLAA